MAAPGDCEDRDATHSNAPITALSWTHKRIFEHNRKYYTDDLTETKDSRAIRLLRLLPGPYSAQIACELRTVSLSTNPKYNALSYAWGNRQDVCSITVNDLNGFVVSRPLWSALQRLRQHAIGEIWIDAICINQAENAERNHQVAIMAPIYSDAETVYVWLGHCLPNSPGASDETCSSHTHTDNGKGGVRFQCPTTGWQDLTDNEGNFWWERLWTVQEFALARQVEVMYGPHLLAWEIFYNGLNDWLFSTQAVSCAPDLQCRFDAAWREFTTLSDLRRRIADNEKVPIDKLIYDWSYREASHELDRVYALLGIFGRQDFDAVVQPDYNKTGLEVCRDITLYLIISNQSLDVLCNGWPRNFAGHSLVVNFLSKRASRSYRAPTTDGITGYSVRDGRLHIADARTQICSDAFIRRWPIIYRQGDVLAYVDLYDCGLGTLGHDLCGKRILLRPADVPGTYTVEDIGTFTLNYHGLVRKDHHLEGFPELFDGSEFRRVRPDQIESLTRMDLVIV